MRDTSPVLTEVRNDQVAYAIPRRGTLHRRCCDRIGSRLRANRAGAGEFYCSAKRGAPSRDGEDDARTIREGRIAFFNAQLKITPAQEAQWQQVEAAMRENAKTLDQTITTARQNRGNMDAVQRLELHEQFAKVRVDNDARLLAAFKPLYASLSPEQQQMANQLVGAHHHWHHRA